MTLYELDEAATRIREEVDSEANIILGATFDESLEGTIRVSVVATGIDQPALAEGQISATEQRIAEVAERLRAEARARAIQPMTGRPAPLDEAVPAVAESTSAMMKAAEIVRHASEAAPAVHSDVVLTPSQAKGANFESLAPVEAPALEMEAAPAAFIPPAPERVMRPTRMPRVEDLPAPAQKQIRAARGEPDAVANERKSLLQRLATVGFGRRDELPAQAPAPAPVAELPASLPVAPEAMSRPAAAMPPAEYAKRPAPAPTPAYRAAKGTLDNQGRSPAPVRNAEDEHLEIPAFLRRHSS